MPKVKLFMDAFKKEYGLLKAMPNGEGVNDNVKMAAADYLMSRLNFMLTKYVLMGTLDPIKFSHDMMLDAIESHNSAVLTDDLYRSIDVQKRYFSEFEFNSSLSEKTKTIAEELDVLSEKLTQAKDKKDRIEVEKGLQKTLSKIPFRILHSEHYYETINEYKSEYASAAKNIARYNLSLKNTLLHLIDCEKVDGQSLFDDYENIKENIENIFKDNKHVDYSKLEAFNNLTDRNGKKYDFYNAARLSEQIRQYVKEAIETKAYDALNDLVDGFEKATNDTIKKYGEKPLYRLSTLATKEGPIARYMVNKSFTTRLINDSKVGNDIKEYSYENEISKKATSFLEGLNLNCSSDVRLETRLAVATMKFNNLSDEKNKNVDDQLAIIKALQQKHAQRGLVWRIFNFIRSGSEIKTIQDMKQNLIERGVSREYIKEALNETKSEEKLYSVPDHIKEVDPLFQKDVKNEYLFDTMEEYLKTVKQKTIFDNEPVVNIQISDEELNSPQNGELPALESLNFNDEAIEMEKDEFGINFLEGYNDENHIVKSVDDKEPVKSIDEIDKEFSL